MPTTVPGSVLTVATVTVALIAALLLLVLTRAIVRFAADPGRGGRPRPGRRSRRSGRDG